MSSQQLNAEKAWIFRIVHRGNLAQVLEHGLVCRNDAKPKTYVEIGNQELIARRLLREVPCTPKGTLADYVPFYFTPFSPMLLNIKTGYGVPKQSMDDILILVSSLPLIAEKEIPFVYSDRHAYLKTAKFSSDLGELSKRIAWGPLQSRDFSKSDIDRFEKYQAEALVYKHVPLDALLCIMSHSDSVRDEVTKACSTKHPNLKIMTGRKWYL